MENKKLIKFIAVAIFTISIQLISVYATPDDSEQIVTKKVSLDENASVASVNDLDDNEQLSSN